ncbi:hypothetical protein GCM10018781_74020 [Kitasatospora indigofera]|uniref:Uncharacterized protein n=1 Tax=Kitasatospora indigofera TaxID=67307 RepID=A0A919L5U8_9ACTN|nr:hypothetical protein GCM10018781_74020 [Kitasatospora indigofera]
MRPKGSGHPAGARVGVAKTYPRGAPLPNQENPMSLEWPKIHPIPDIPMIGPSD